MRNAKSAHCLVTAPPDTPGGKGLIMHPLSYLEKRQAIKRLNTESPLSGLAANYLIAFLPTMASIDVESTLRTSSLAGHPTIVLRPKKRFDAATLGLKRRSHDGTPLTLWLSGTLQLNHSQGPPTVSSVYVWVAASDLPTSRMQKLFRRSTQLTVFDLETHSLTSSTTSERSIVPLRNGHLPSGRRSKCRRMP